MLTVPIRNGPGKFQVPLRAARRLDNRCGPAHEQDGYSGIGDNLVGTAADYCCASFANVPTGGPSSD